MNSASHTQDVSALGELVTSKLSLKTSENQAIAEAF